MSAGGGAEDGAWPTVIPGFVAWLCSPGLVPEVELFISIARTCSTTMAR